MKAIFKQFFSNLCVKLFKKLQIEMSNRKIRNIGGQKNCDKLGRSMSSEIEVLYFLNSNPLMWFNVVFPQNNDKGLNKLKDLIIQLFG